MPRESRATVVASYIRVIRITAATDRDRQSYRIGESLRLFAGHAVAATFRMPVRDRC